MRRARDGNGFGWLVVPALVLTVAVLGTGIGSLLAASLGLMPLYGEPALSVRGYVDAAPDLITGMRESVAIAVPSTLIAMTVGVPAGLVLWRAASAGRQTGVGLAVAIVIASPHLVGAAGATLLLSGGGILPRLLDVGSHQWPALVGGRWPIAVVLVLAWKESAFVALAVASTLGSRVSELLKVASVLGAGPAERARTILLPLLAPGALGAGSAVLVYALGAYEVAWLLGAAYPESLPVMAYRLFGEIDLSTRPKAAAVALVSVLIATLAAGSVVPFLHRLGASR